MELRQKIDLLDTTLVNILNESSNFAWNGSCEKKLKVFFDEERMKTSFNEVIMFASIALQKKVSSYLEHTKQHAHQRFGDSIAYVPQKQVLGIK